MGQTFEGLIQQAAATVTVSEESLLVELALPYERIRDARAVTKDCVMVKCGEILVWFDTDGAEELANLVRDRIPRGLAEPAAEPAPVVPEGTEAPNPPIRRRRRWRL